MASLIGKLVLQIEKMRFYVPNIILQAVESISGMPLKGKRTLDISCGWGGFVVAGLEMGMDAWGCDIDSDGLEIGKLRSKLHKVTGKFIHCAADKSPFVRDGAAVSVASRSCGTHKLRL